MLRKSIVLLFLLISVKVFGQPPAVQFFSPTSGQVGTVVTLNGRNFNTTASANVVYIGGVRANVISATASTLTVSVPLGAVYQPISVLNTGNGLTGASVVPFIVTADTRGTITTADFDAPVDFNGSSSPIIMGDIDGDGKLDMIGVNYYANSVTITRNIAVKGVINSSSFASAVSVTTGTSPNAVVLQDMDGDGKPDLVVCNNSSNTVSVYHNNAVSGTINASTFSTKVDFVTTSTPTSMAVGDIDGDGRPDIIVTAQSGIASFLLNKSGIGIINSASFASKVDLQLGLNKILLADLDSDGKLDIVGTSGTGVSVIHNVMTVTGSVNAASFETRLTYTGGFSTFGVAVADVNNDGKPDILAIDNIDNKLSIYQNATNGAVIDAGSFLTRVTFATGKYPFTLSVNDIDGDGLLDVVIPHYTDNNLSVFHNINTAMGGAITTATFAPKLDIATGNIPQAATTADIDGDGRVDIVFQNSSSKISFIHNNPLTPPVITSISPLSGPVGTTVTITGSNFNKNAIANNVVYFGATRATVTSATSTQVIVTVPAGSTFKNISVLNTESQRSGYSSKPFIVTYPGKSRLLARDFEQVGGSLTSGLFKFRLDMSDIDGDGKPDIIGGDKNGKNVTVWRNTTTASGAGGQFAFAVKFDGGDKISDIKIGDIDGDGKPDIVTVNLAANTVSILRNISTPGNIAFEKRVNITSSLYYNPLYVTLADINMDGKLDLIFNEFSGGVSILRNTSTTGTISFTQSQIGTYLESYQRVRVGDMDGDGKPDLVVNINQNTSGANSIAIIRNTSTGGVLSFAAPVVLNFLSGDFDLADMDNDGKPDIAIVFGENVMRVLRNNSVPGPIVASAFTMLSLDVNQDNPQFAYFADMNGDGKVDVVTINRDLYNHRTFSIYVNNSTNGNLAFDNQVDVDTPVYDYDTFQDLYLNDLVIGDIDGDGLPDVATTSAYNINILYNHPLATASLVAPVITAVSPAAAAAGATITISGSNFNTTAAGNIVTFGDVNAKVTSASATSITVTVPAGAAYKNLSVTNTTTGLLSFSAKPFNVIFPSKGSIALTDFRAPVVLSTATDQNTTFNHKAILCDVDGDGKVDIVSCIEVQSAIFKVSVILNQSSAPGAPLTAASFGLIKEIDTRGITEIMMQDIDGDGKPDLIAEWGGYYYSIRKNNSTLGNITFGPAILTSVNSGSIINCTTDIDGDGLADLICSGPSGLASVSVVPNTSARSVISFGTQKVFSISTIPVTINTGDIDGDGKPDIIVTCQDSSMQVLRNTCNGKGINTSSFAPPVKYNTGKYYGFGSLADFDGDGKLDVIVSNPVTNVFRVFINTSTTGNISFAAPVDISVPNIGATSMRFNDMDGDGKPDVVVSNFAGGVSVFKNTSKPGNVSCAAKVDFSLVSSSSGTNGNALGDIDGDGKPDMVLLSWLGKLSIFQNIMEVPTKPVITAFTPQSAKTGTTVNITGTDFYSVTAVSFGGVVAQSFTVNSPTSITAIVGAGGTGDVTITTSTATANLAGFTYIASNNFTLAVTSITCKGANNGIINITAKSDLNYTATVTGGSVNTTQTFTTTTTFNNLGVGNYNVCISITGQTGSQQCYTLVVTEPKDITLYSSVSADNKTITLSLTGGSIYNIQLNGALRTTTDSTITLPLTAGRNSLVVTTDKPCQGVIDKTITASDIVIPYPDPFENTLYLNIGKQNINRATVEVYSAMGALVYKGQFSNPSNTITLDLSSIKMVGAYTLKLTADGNTQVFKIIKK